MTREELDSDGERSVHNAPTREETAENRYPVLCGICGGAWRVDTATHEKVTRAAQYDRNDSAFICAECEAEYEDSEY